MNNIDILVRKQIKQMKEIDWGDIPENNPYRLLWGENQVQLFEYSKEIKSELAKINLYPSPTKFFLRQKIARYCRTKPDNIIVTNGSDEALELIAKVFLDNNNEVIIPSPSYPCFDSVSQMMGAKIKKVPLKKDFSLDIEFLLKKVTNKTKIIWIANPNNPTGNILIQEDEIEKLSQNTDSIIVFDECYFELGNITAAGFINRYPQIIITRSFSKVFALAGARLGYIIANTAVTKYINRLEQTNQVFNVNRFAQAAGKAILGNPKRIKQYIRIFLDVKKSFEKQLKEIPLDVFPTNTTFCLIKLPLSISGKAMKDKLLQKGIYIKDCSIYENLGKQFIYLGIPQRKFQKRVIDSIKEIIRR